MLTPKKALAASRVYTEETAIGMGALKGANCTIKSITKTEGLNTVIFEWTDTEGGKHESIMLVYDGAPGTPGQDGDDGFSPTIVVKSSTSTEYILTITDKNGSYDTPNLKGSGGGGASAMSDLTDVDLTALANGSVLVYDSTAAKWEATALSLSDISGIDLTGITDGQILAWDAANNKFVPADNTGEEYTAGEGIEISQDNEISSKIVMYTGTKAAWDALPLADKKKYTHASFTDDTQSGIVDNVPTENSDNLVKSGGVFAALEDKADVTDLNTKADIATTLAGYGITNAYTKTETDAAITAEIEKLDVSDAAVSGSYVTEVSEADGKISVVREAADAVPTELSNKMVKSGGVYSANQTIYEVMGKNGAKNKEPFDIDVVKALNTTGTWTGNSYELNGITFAFADDGKVTVSGTASALCSITISGNYDLNGGYIITGCPSGGGGSTYSLRIYDSSATVVADDVGEGVSFTANNLTNCRTNLIVRKDAAISTPIVFAPMIRDSKDTDPTYQPYTKTNQQLTQETTALDENVKNNGAVNMLSNIATTIYINGITFTVNADGSVTADGTASATTELVIAVATPDNPLIGKKVRLTGCPKGGNNNDTYSIQAYRMGSTDGSEGSFSDFGDGVVFDWKNNASGTVGNIKLIIRNGYVANNLVFKPMVSYPSFDLTYDDFIPYAKSNRELTEVTASAIANVPNGAINLAKPNLAGTTTLNNVEFVIDSEGKVTANGTASANLRFDMAEVTLKAGKTYKICEPSSLQARRPFAPETYRCYARIKSSGVWVLQNNGWKERYTPTEDVVVSVGIAMQSGNQVTDEIFAPMIVLDGTDVGDTFYLYAMTNRELTEGAGLPKKTLIRTLANGQITVTIPKYLGSSYAQGSLKLIGSNADSEAHVTFCLNADNTAVTVSKLTNLGSKELTLDSASISGNNLVLEISGVQNYAWASAEYFMSLSAGANAVQPTWTFIGS